jgi:AcrR family transcriptional regulator
MIDVVEPIDGQARRRLESRRKLLAAARELFIERGYEATRPQDIAKSAGVANGTFYLHFKGKEDAFLAFADDAQSQLIAEYRNNLAGVSGLRERLTVILRTLMAFDVEHPGVLHVAFLDPLTIAPEDSDARRIYDRFGDFLYLILGEQETLGDRELPGVDGFDPALISHALCGFVGNALMYVVRRDMASEAMIENVVGFVERALLPSLPQDQLQRTAAT